MSSTNSDDQSEKHGKLQSDASLAKQHSAVSPLLDNIVGGADRFIAASSESKPSESTEPTEASGDDAQLAPSPDDAAEQQATLFSSDSAIKAEAKSASITELQLSPDIESAPCAQAEEANSQDSLEKLSLSEQYGDAGLLAELNALAQTQQFQLDQHREYILRSRAEQEQQLKNWQMRCAALEEQLQAARDRAALLEQRHLASQSQVIPLEAQRDAAQQLTERLQTEILDHRQARAVLEEQLDLAEATLKEQQEISTAQSHGIVSMQAELSQAQMQVASLETRLSHQEHLRQRLKADGSRDRQGRSNARDRQLKLEQETTQMTGQLLRLSEELRQTQRQSIQWRRQAQAQTEQLQDIAQWAAQAESVPPELMALLEPLFNSPDITEELLPASSPESGEIHPVAEATPFDTSHPSSLDLPNFPHGNV